MDFTYAPGIFSGMILRISASNPLSIAYGSGSFFNLMARYPPISSLVGCTEGISGYPGRYFLASSRMCGLPVMNSRTFGHSAIMCCKESQRSGRCFAGNSSKASMQMNPRRKEEIDLMSIAQISGSRSARPPTSLFALSKASFIALGVLVPPPRRVASGEMLIGQSPIVLYAHGSRSIRRPLLYCPYPTCRTVCLLQESFVSALKLVLQNKNI